MGPSPADQAAFRVASGTTPVLSTKEGSSAGGLCQGHEVHKQLTSRKVEIEIDKQSMKKAQKAIEDVFAPLKKWFK